MNTVLIQLNSYIGQAKVYLNGSEPSSYSELSNYSYQMKISGEVMMIFERVWLIKTRPILLDHCIQILRLFTHGTRRYNNENSN